MQDDKNLLNPEGEHNEPSAANENRPETANAMPQETVEASRMEQDPVMELPEIPAVEAGNDAPLVLPVEAPKQKKSAGWKLFAAAVALVAVGAGVGGATTWALVRNLQTNSAPIGYKVSATSGATSVANVPIGQGNVIPDIYRKVSPSVVWIKVNIQKGWQRGQASGSGFVVDPSGYILTNNHVIDGGSNITVQFVDGTVLPAKVVGTDKYKDLAVIKVDPGNRQLIAATLGDSDKVQVGELAVAIGSPFDQEFTVTAGIVSGVNRNLEEDNNPFTIPGGIQTDAAINPGNSGGPLLNGNGEVIGINTLIETGNSGASGNIGIGFAVPINAAKEIMPTLMQGKAVSYPALGIGLADMADVSWSAQPSVKEGAIVARVYSGSGAEAAGLQEPAATRAGKVTSADIIVAIDGKAIKDSQDVISYIQGKKVGDTVTLTVVRGKDRVTIPVKLSDRSQINMDNSNN